MLLNSARQLRGVFGKSPVSSRRASLSPSPPTKSKWLSSQLPGGKGPVFISREWLKVPGRRCRLLSLWETVGDISDTMQTPVGGGPGLSVLDPSSPRSKVVALDQGLDGSGRTGRVQGDQGTSYYGPESWSREPVPWLEAQAMPRWMPLGAESRSLKKPPGQPRRARSWRKGPWCCDGNRRLTAARSNGQVAERPPALAATNAADSSFSTGLQRHQITSCVVLQEVVLVSNESCPRLCSKPIRTRSRGRAGKQRWVGTRNSGGRDLMGGLTRAHSAATARCRESSCSVSACGSLESVGLGHWACGATWGLAEPCAAGLASEASLAKRGLIFRMGKGRAQTPGWLCVLPLSCESSRNREEKNWSLQNFLSSGKGALCPRKGRKRPGKMVKGCLYSTHLQNEWSFSEVLGFSVFHFSSVVERHVEERGSRWPHPLSCVDWNYKTHHIPLFLSYYKRSCKS